MLKAYLSDIGRFPRWSLAYTTLMLLAAIAHRLALWTPFYIPFGAPIFFGLLGLVLLTLSMFLYAIGAFFELGYIFAAKILFCAVLMTIAILLVANIDAPTIIYAT